MIRQRSRLVEPTPLSAAEVAALRYAVETHRLYVLYELSWTLGIRKAELLGLTLAGLDLQAATITVSQQVLDLDDGPSIEPYTKNDKVRTLPLTARLVALCRIRLEQLLAERGEGWIEHGLLFPSERGTPMSERNLDRHFKAACVTARVHVVTRTLTNGKDYRTSNLKFHHLRHTCLSWLGDTDANDMVIKAIAGHADEDVTDRYVHVGLDAMRDAERTAIERRDSSRRVWPWWIAVGASQAFNCWYMPDNAAPSAVSLAVQVSGAMPWLRAPPLLYAVEEG